MKLGKILAAVFAAALLIASAGCAGKDKQTVLTVLTHRTDRIQDGSLAEMTKAFEAANNVKVVYKGYTAYASDVSTMLKTDDYGVVLMIPDTVKISDLGAFFEPLGNYADLNKKYLWANQKMYDNVVYGIAHLGTVAGGIVYNKRVWRQAGVTELPKTPEAFLDGLAKIKANVPDCIPYYTNFNSAWVSAQWPSLILSAAGDPNYENDILINRKPLFEKDGAYYKVYKLLFDLYHVPAFHERDPMTADWEGSKPAINNGQIATMVMGSWAVNQFKEAGLHPEDIGYMPAPFSTNGKQYAQMAADYCLGINVHAKADLKELGKKYITWFVDDSGFAQREGGVSALRGSDLPDYLEAFETAELFVATPAPDALNGVWDEIAKESEVNPWGDESGNFKLRIGQLAFRADTTFEKDVLPIYAEMDKKWAAARDKNGKLNAYF